MREESGDKKVDATGNFDERDVIKDFNDCYEKYYRVIFKHAAYLTGNSQVAEDITQEAFIKLYNSPQQHTNTAAWLSRVATNLAYNYFRREKIRSNKEPTIKHHAQSNVISLEDAAIRDFEIRMTRNILNRLKARDRICLLLKFSGYKYSEISEIAGVEKTSIGKILARAQEKFKEMYLKEVRD